MTYLGTYPSAIDDKGRIVFPVNLRGVMDAQDDDTWYFTLGFDGAIFMFSSRRWEQVVAQVSGGAMLDPQMVDFRRMLLGSAGKSKRDGQNRIVIPQHLREYADLKTEAVLIGAGDHLELWSKAGWQAFQQRQLMDYKAMAAQLFGAKPGPGAEETGGNGNAQH